MVESAYLFGTAGWSYKDWDGTVYPSPKPRGFNPLLFLSQEFDFVEVNTTFYHIPSLKLTEGWVQKTESVTGFQFWIKLYQDFTHKGILDSGSLCSFKRALEPLKVSGKLAGVLAQFPYSFRLTTGNLNYLKALGEQFKEYGVAVEFRHNGWNRREVWDEFSGMGWIFVNIDQPLISQSLPLTSVVTNGEMSYVRLHGRNYRTWFADEGRDARYDYDYKTEELNQIAEIVKKISELSRKIFISGNNHYKGSAVKNLNELKRLLAQNT